jgi:acyl-CoA thioester hydrolase
MESLGKLHTPIALRFCDTDLIGHINNVSFAAYAESGRIALFRHYGYRGSDLILVHLGIDFRAQLQLDDKCVIKSWVERVGNSSVTIRQEVMANDKVAAEIKSVVVTFDYETDEPKPVPEALREAIATKPLTTHKP